MSIRYLHSQVLNREYYLPFTLLFNIVLGNIVAIMVLTILARFSQECFATFKSAYGHGVTLRTIGVLMFEVLIYLVLSIKRPASDRCQSRQVEVDSLLILCYNTL